MSSHRSDNESDTEVFVDAEESLDQNTLTTTISSDNINGLESNNSNNDSVQPDPTLSNKPAAIEIPQISVTDMSYEDNKELSDLTKDQENGHVTIPENEPVDVTVYVKDLDTGKKIPASDLEEEIKKSNGNIDPLSFHIMQRTGSDTEMNHDENHTRSISDEDINTTEDKPNRYDHVVYQDDGITGNTAPVFSENADGFGRAQPRYIKTRARNKPIKEFDRLFLAQELYNPLSSDDDGLTDFKTGAIWSMKFSKDGKFLATGGQDTVVRVWAVISSDEEREHFLEGSGTSVYEGISGAKLGAPVFRDKPLYEYRGHTADILDLIASWNELSDSQLITAVGFTLDGKMAVAGSLSGKCLFYETDGLKYNTQIHVKSARGKNSQGKKITGIESMPGTLPGQEKLLISSNDSRIRLYNMRDKSLECKFKGIENTITVAIFAPTRTKQLISLCGDPIFAHTVNNENSASQTYPDGNIIVCADYTGSIKIFRQDCAYYPSRDSDSFQCSCGSTEFKAFVKDGAPKLICASCNQIN
ncbi:19744_t:CDS:2 [Racocetra fulgida]|uniref:19744_t:CDS:1 n=1 Tax=Racocetra fulgida TaxID=60492 RepID=A0A9N8ZEY0_9GLOM|nr:19744_t:CDS:2 [Racocetra fulgida]